MKPSFLIEALNARHDRDHFKCGVEVLDRYLREQAGQDVRRRITACYIALEKSTKIIAGYYTLAAASVALSDLPGTLIDKLPRYPSVPVVRLGRLAVATPFHGQGLGGALLWDALRRAARSEIAMYAMIIDAKDEQAASFYLHYKFHSFDSQPRQFILPLKGIHD